MVVVLKLRQPADRGTPKQVDSFAKLLQRLARVAKSATEVNGELILPPSQIYLSPTLVRDFTCVTGCNACCTRITLDFLPDEVETFAWRKREAAEVRKMFKPRSLSLNNRQIEVLSYPQYLDDKCPFLKPVRDDGALGCSLWTVADSTQPLECSSAPNLMFDYNTTTNSTYIKKRPYGRAWQWKNTPQCEFTSNVTDAAVASELKLLKRYEHWAEKLGIDTWLADIIKNTAYLPEYIRSGRHAPLPVITSKGLL